jgi:hypothetical protein
LDSLGNLDHNIYLKPLIKNNNKDE